MADVLAATPPSHSTAVQNTIIAGDDARLPSPPFVRLEGVPNFRDLGGHGCEPALSIHKPIEVKRRSTRPGYFFRSAQPAHITSKGLETLTSGLNIHDVYDLRSFKEVRLMNARYPDLPPDIPGVKRHHVPIYKDEDYTPISMAEKYGLGSDSKPGNIRPREGFVQAYEDILRQAAGSGSYRAILVHVLKQPDEPLLFHCTVGKDRTGVFAALMLKLCGVSDEAVIWDYALTTQGLGKWREHLIKRILDGAGTEYANKNVIADEGVAQGKPLPTREEAERVVGSHAEDMEAFLTMVLKGKFGSARRYFRECCGFADAELDRVVETLTIEGEGYDFDYRRSDV